MQVTLEKAGFFSEVINIISDLVSELRLKFTAEGLQIVAIDPTNAAMIIFKVPSSVFSNYKVDGEEIIGLDLDNFKQVLKRGKQESLTLETKEGKLLVTFGESKKNFVLSITSAEEEERKEPELKFAATLKIDASKLQEAVEDCSVVSDSILFNIDEKGFELSAKGALHSASIKLLNESFKDSVKARYSVDYLQKMVKAARISDEVKVQFSTDYPLKLHYTTPEKAELSFILAPRVETE